MMQRLFTIFLILGCYFSGQSETIPIKLLLSAHGQIGIGTNIHGTPKYGDLAPGYRADIIAYADILSVNEVLFDFLAGSTTSIARLPETPIKMDRIRYYLTPALRYAFKKTMITGLLFHECIHTISREEISGSTWWNIIQLGMGTKGAYPFYFIEKYNNRDFSLRNSFDAQINLGHFLRGKSEWIGHNHTYASEAFGLIRYHFGLFRNQTIYIDVLPHLWVDLKDNLTTKISGEINWVILANDNIATVYFNQCFKDDNPYDNEDMLSTVGFKIIF